MASLLTAVGLFVCAFAAHVLIWRIRIPHRQTRALIIVFVLVPPLAGTAVLFRHATAAPWCPPLADLPSIALFYAGAACCYLITYAGVEEASPSLLIIRALEAAAEKGCARSDLAALLTEERFVEPRIRALENQNITAATSEGSRLTRRGMRLAVMAAFLAKCFRINEGG